VAVLKKHRVNYLDKETIIIGLLLVLIGLIGGRFCCFLIALVIPGALLVLIGLLRPEPKGIKRILEKW